MSYDGIVADIGEKVNMARLTPETNALASGNDRFAPFPANAEKRRDAATMLAFDFNAGLDQSSFEEELAAGTAVIRHAFLMHALILSILISNLYKK